MGFFSIATLGLALRPLFTSHYLILNLFNPGWVWIIRFEYLTLYLTIIGWSWFVLNLYPSKLFKVIVWTITTFFLLAFSLTIFLPVKIFSYTMLVYYPGMLILMIYLLFKSLIGTFKRNTIDIIYFLAFIVLLLGGVHDIRVSLGKSVGPFGYVLTYIIVFFVFMTITSDPNIVNL